MGARVSGDARRGVTRSEPRCQVCDGTSDVRPTDTKAHGTILMCEGCRVRYKDYLKPAPTEATA